uniref:Uncharacterized protein n=1 Tax=Oreochromis aureus TaxID=47969 RepID=A0A668V133_OREAU
KGVISFFDNITHKKPENSLLGITETLWSRSIADPPRDTVGLFLEKKSRTSERVDSLTYQRFLRDIPRKLQCCCT